MSLLGCQLWVPHIHDEDQPERRGVLPHLVLERVVKDEHLAFFPSPVTEKHGFRRCTFTVTFAIRPENWNTKLRWSLPLVIKKELQDFYHEHSLQCSAREYAKDRGLVIRPGRLTLSLALQLLLV